MLAILDANAIIAFLRNESGADIIRAIFEDDTNLCLAHSINMCEAYYVLSRLTDEQRVVTALKGFATYGLVIREDMDQEFWQAAARLKATIRRVSLTDCFAIALANRVSGEVVTSDHHEFDPITA